MHNTMVGNQVDQITVEESDEDGQGTEEDNVSASDVRRMTIKDFAKQ